MLTPSQKGAIAETAIMAAATKLGVRVWLPLTEGGRSDLVLEVGSRLLRVQCKWAARKGGVLVVHTGTCRLTPRGYLRTSYSAEEVDATEQAEGAEWLQRIEEENAGELTPERLAKLEAEKARADADAMDEVLKPRLDEDASPTAGRRFTRA